MGKEQGEPQQKNLFHRNPKKRQIKNLEITAGVALYSNQEGEGQSEGRMRRIVKRTHTRKPSKENTKHRT